MQFKLKGKTFKGLTMVNKKKFEWENKICNHAQVGGIETSVLDNGLGKGTRIAWFNTGSGLRFKVVVDRAMDIVDAFFNEYSLAWISHCGVTAPRPDANKGFEWLYSFAGGLVTTCGLTHVGGPEKDDSEERGLHGRISNIPAEVESIIQPDPINGKLEMSMTGVVKESRLFGVTYELRRTITAEIGKPIIRIKDVVTNKAMTQQPLMLLYHCNFGWPLVDEGTDIIWRGKCVSRGTGKDDVIFNDKHNYKKCPNPLEIHRASEACGYIDLEADKKGFCLMGLSNQKIGLAVAIKYKKKQLPWMANWQHWSFGEYVTGIEPGTNPPIGQIEARNIKQLVKLQPGQSRTQELEIAVLADKEDIENFISIAG